MVPEDQPGWVLACELAVLLRRGGPGSRLGLLLVATAGIMLVASCTLFFEATGDLRDFFWNASYSSFPPWLTTFLIPWRLPG